MRIAIIALILSAGPLAAGSYDGIYRPDADWAQGWDCTSIGMDGGALAIRDNTFYGVESACEMTNPTAIRDMDATLFDMQCSAEGDTYQARVMLMSTPEGVLVIRDGGDTSRLIHC